MYIRPKNGPTLWQTNMEILPRPKRETKDEKPKDIICSTSSMKDKEGENRLSLPSRYIYTPHLTYLNPIEKDLLNKVRPPVLNYDEWARIPYGKYHLTVSPNEIHQESLSHATYSNPVPGRLPPIIFK
ncbi:unnamed protein product [Trichobilharzia regenti]|nr:unnamed protein product [Trichobilharzia regenti]